MKQILLGTLVLLSAVLSSAAPRLLTGAEKDKFVKALTYSLRASGDFACLATTADVTAKINEMKNADSVAYLQKIVADGRNVYIDENLGAQPVIQIAGKSIAGYDHVSSYLSDKDYQKIVKIEYKETTDVEYNAGNLLNPNFQIRKENIFVNHCKAAQ